MILYPIGTSKSCLQAVTFLERDVISLLDHPAPEVSHLLLDIPSFLPDGRLRDGSRIETILRMLPPEICIIGGNLNHPALKEYRRIDLLQDPDYLAQNAAITADCALKLAAPLMSTTFRDSAALITGWGRIGKCLAAMLHGLGCRVIIAARKASDRAMICALGYEATDYHQINRILPQCTLLFNTVPAMVCSQEIPEGCIALELASLDGITGKNVITARGLPGKYAPKTTGKLIARRILELYKEEAL